MEWIFSRGLTELKYCIVYYVQAIIGQTKSGKSRSHEVEICLTYSRQQEAKGKLIIMKNWKSSQILLKTFHGILNTVKEHWNVWTVVGLDVE